MRHVPHVAIIVPEAAFAASIGAYADIFHAANRYARSQYGEVDPRGGTFEIVHLWTLGIAAAHVPLAQGWEWHADATIAADHIYDLVVVAGCEPNNEGGRAEAPELAAWLRMQRGGGALIAASGAAVHLLGQAGLLTGRKATAPWWLQSALAARCPGVRLTNSDRITEDDGIFCAAYPFDDQILALQLIERIATARLADWLAHAIGIDRSGTGGLPSVQHHGADTLVERAKHWLHGRFSHPIRIGELATAMGVSERTLARRFVASEGVTPLAYLQGHRVSVAQRMLDMTDYRLDRIASLVGYGDAAFFARMFKARTGVSPRQWRNRRQ